MSQLGRGLVAALACAIAAAATPAAALVVGSSAENGDGTWTYSYTVGDAKSEFDVAAWSLEFDFLAPDWNQLDMLSGGDVTVPNAGWIAEAGTPVEGLSAQDFVSLDPSSDVLAGEVLAGFAFTSAIPPGRVLYLEFTPDGDSFADTTVGPSSVPEPGWLAAIVALLALTLAPALRAAAAPSIASIDVQTPPLFRGIPFEISVVASADTVRVIAMMDFRPVSANLVRIALEKKGAVWTGVAAVPGGVLTGPDTLANIRVMAFDAANARTVAVVKVAVSPIGALFEQDEGELYVVGSSGDDTIAVSRNASGGITVNGGAIPIADGPATVANTTKVYVYAQAGDDRISVDRASGLLLASELYGGDGDDVLSGGNGVDMLYGDEGNDLMDGGPGQDFVVAGPGDDTFVWKAGDGSESNEGLDGYDTFVITGSDAGEQIDLFLEGSRLRVEVDHVLFDAGDIESVRIAARGGADTVTATGFTATRTKALTVDLGSDGQADQVIVRGKGGADHIAVSGSAAGAVVTGLGPVISVLGADRTLDQLTVDGSGGNDAIDASTLPSGLILLRELGGAGDDVLIGSPGDDVQDGGPGTNVVIP